MGNVFAVVAGLMVGSLWNMGIVQLNLRVLHPMPSGLDMNDAEPFDAFMATHNVPHAHFVSIDTEGMCHILPRARANAIPW